MTFRNSPTPLALPSQMGHYGRCTDFVNSRCCRRCAKHCKICSVVPSPKTRGRDCGGSQQEVCSPVRMRPPKRVKSEADDLDDMSVSSRGSATSSVLSAASSSSSPAAGGMMPPVMEVSRKKGSVGSSGKGGGGAGGGGGGGGDRKSAKTSATAQNFMNALGRGQGGEKESRSSSGCGPAGSIPTIGQVFGNSLACFGGER